MNKASSAVSAYHLRMNRYRCGSPLLLLLALLLTNLAAAPAPVTATIEHQGTAFTLHVRLTIPPGLHAQSHKPLDDSLIPLTLRLDPNAAVSFGPVRYPPAQLKMFPSGRASVYTGAVDIAVPLTFATATNQPVLTGSLRYQACNDVACFPPKTVHFEASPTASPPVPTTSSTIAPPATVPSTATGAPPTANAPTIFGQDIASIGTPLLFAAAFVIGIIFNAVPCVLPVVPLKIVGFYEASHHDRRKSILLGAVFSMGLVASFGVLALLIVVLRVLDWGGLFQHTGFTAGIVAILAVMAASQFGLFTFNLPTAAYAFTPRHDTLPGNFLFGMLTALLSTPCTIGPFTGLLAWALKQPPALGVAAIMTVGAGMAFPYFVLSGFPEVARRFPRVGPWAELIKQEMGFLLLVAAVFFAQPLLPRFVADRVFWWSLFAVIAAAAMFLLVRTVSLSPRTAPRLIAALIALGVIVPSAYAARQLTVEPYDWIPYTDSALATARATGRPVLIDFTASWCGNCHYVEAFVLNTWRIHHLVDQDRVIMIKADVTTDTAPALPLLAQLNPSSAIPLTAVYLPGKPTPTLLVGIYNVNDLQQALPR